MSDCTDVIVREHDANLMVWFEEQDAPRVSQLRDALLDVLTHHGWVIEPDPDVARDFPSLLPNHQRGRHGDLQCRIGRMGRVVELTFYQDKVKTHPISGRYDFDRRGNMPYLVGLRYEATIRAIDAFLIAEGAPPIERRVRLKGMAYVSDQREGWKRSHGADFYDQIDPRNARSGGHAPLEDGDCVYFLDSAARSGHHGRLLRGRAWHNVNNMWWVVLPGGEVRNMACFNLLHREDVSSLKGRHTPEPVFAQRLKAMQDKAVSEERFEHAAVLRDLMHTRHARLDKAI